VWKFLQKWLLEVAPAVQLEARVLSLLMKKLLIQ